MIDRRFAHLEFQGATCDPKAVAASVRASGCALVRGALSPSMTGYLADILPFLFRYMDLRETYSHNPPKPARLPLIRMDVMPALAEPLGFDVTGALLSGFGQSILPKINDAYFKGGAIEIPPRMTIARRQSPTDGANALPFHQDGKNYIEMDFLNFWIPVTPAGEDAPGMEVAPVALTDCMDVTTAASLHPIVELDADTVAQRFGADNFFHPAMLPGDVLLINQYTVHRTYMPPGAARERFSIEFRVLQA